MRDRIPTYPGRVRLTPVSGQADIFDMTMADDPKQLGDPPTKANLLKDTTAEALGLDPGANPVVDDAFMKIAKDGASQVGDILATARTDLGENWLLCNGDLVSREDYPELSPLISSYTGLYKSPYPAVGNTKYDWSYGMTLLYAGKSTFVWHLDSNKYLKKYAELTAEPVTQTGLSRYGVQLTNFAKIGQLYKSVSVDGSYISTFTYDLDTDQVTNLTVTLSDDYTNFISPLYDDGGMTLVSNEPSYRLYRVNSADGGQTWNYAIILLDNTVRSYYSAFRTDDGTWAAYSRTFNNGTNETTIYVRTTKNLASAVWSDERVVTAVTGNTTWYPRYSPYGGGKLILESWKPVYAGVYMVINLTSASLHIADDIYGTNLRNVDLTWLIEAVGATSTKRACVFSFVNNAGEYMLFVYPDGNYDPLNLYIFKLNYETAALEFIYKISDIPKFQAVAYNNGICALVADDSVYFISEYEFALPSISADKAHVYIKAKEDSSDGNL